MIPDQLSGPSDFVIIYVALVILFKLSIHNIIGKLAFNLPSHVIGLFIVVVLVCEIQQIYFREWLNVAILLGVEAVCVVLQFSTMFLAELAGEWADSLGAFLYSKIMKGCAKTDFPKDEIQTPLAWMRE